MELAVPLMELTVPLQEWEDGSCIVHLSCWLVTSLHRYCYSSKIPSSALLDYTVLLLLSVYLSGQCKVLELKVNLLSEHPVGHVKQTTVPAGSTLAPGVR
jgi:hypothetical protein